MTWCLWTQWPGPDKQDFSQIAIPKMYDSWKKTVESELGQVERYACTTGLWSSRRTDPYISLTVHFLDQDFELKMQCQKHCVLLTWGFGQLASHLREELLVCVAMDNGLNIIKTTKLTNWVRLQCFGHRLHLAIARYINTCLLYVLIIVIFLSKMTRIIHRWFRDSCFIT